MPKYTVTDPSSGRKVTLTGDSPPNEQELEEIFSKVNASSAPVQEPRPGPQASASQTKAEPSKGLLVRAMQSAPVQMVGEAVSRVSDAPMRAGLSAAMDVATQDPESSTISQLPQGVAAFARGFAGQFGRPAAQAPQDILERTNPGSQPLNTRVPDFLNKSLQPGDNDHLPVALPGFKTVGELKGALRTALGFTPNQVGEMAIDMASPIPLASEATAVYKGGAKMAGPMARMAAEGTGKAISGAAKAADVVTGTKAATKTVNLAKDALTGTIDAGKSVAAAIKKTYGSNVDPKFAQRAAVAQKAGIDPKDLPDAIKFGKNSVASKQQRHSMEAFGAAEADKFDATLGKVQTAVRKEIEDIGTGRKITGGEPLSKKPIPATRYEAGERIKNAYDESVDTYFKDLDVSYQKLAAENPGMKIPAATMTKFNGKLANLENETKKLLKNTFDDVSQAQGNQILKAVARAKQSTGDYADFVDALQGVGRTAFKVKNTMAAIPPDVAKFRKLYGDMSELAVETVGKNLGKDVAEDLLRKNKEMHQLFGDKAILSQMGDVVKSSDKLFDAIVKDPLRVKTIKKYLPEEEIAAMKGRVLQDLIKENSEGDFAFKSLHNALHNKSQREALNALFDPGELADFQDLIDLGDSFGPKVLSTSGTGASNQMTGLVDKTIEASRNPLKTIPAGVEKALANKQRKGALSKWEEMQKEAGKASEGKRNVKPAPGMNFSVRDFAGGGLSVKPRSKLAQMAYKNNQKDSER